MQTPDSASRRIRPPLGKDRADGRSRCRCTHARSADRNRKQSPGPRASLTPRLHCVCTSARQAVLEVAHARHHLLAVAQAPEVLTRGDRSHGRQAVPLPPDSQSRTRRAADDPLTRSWPRRELIRDYLSRADLPAGREGAQRLCCSAVIVRCDHAGVVEEMRAGVAAVAGDVGVEIRAQLELSAQEGSEVGLDC